MIITPIVLVMSLSILGFGIFMGMFVVAYSQESFAAKIVRLLRDRNKEDIFDSTKGIRNVLLDLSSRLDDGRPVNLNTEEEPEDLSEMINPPWPAEFRVSEANSLEWKEFDCMREALTALDEELQEKTKYLSQWIDAFYDLEKEFSSFEESNSQSNAKKNEQIMILKGLVDGYEEENRHREDLHNAMEMNAKFFERLMEARNEEIEALVKELAGYREKEQESKEIDAVYLLSVLEYFSNENIPELSSVAKDWLSHYPDAIKVINDEFISQLNDKDFQKKHGIVGWEKRI